MKKRLFAWVVVALVVFAVVKAAAAFKNPWSMPSVAVPPNAVLRALPPAAEGCGVRCYD